MKFERGDVASTSRLGQLGQKRIRGHGACLYNTSQQITTVEVENVRIFITGNLQTPFHRQWPARSSPNCLIS
jgi:hypothetical protein